MTFFGCIGLKGLPSALRYCSLELRRSYVNYITNITQHLKFEIEETALDSNLLDGKTFVVSGVFSQFSRDEIKDLIEKNGGKNVSSISAKTGYVLAGDNMGPAKLEKASSLGIPIISEADFIKMIAE